MIVTHQLPSNSLAMWYYNEEGILMFWMENDHVEFEKKSHFISLTELRSSFIPDSVDVRIYDDGEP
jgi:hypothetical protein